MNTSRKIKIYLDDFRDPKDSVFYMFKDLGYDSQIYMEQWNVVKNFDEFKKLVNEQVGNISHVSYDHDLADIHYTLNEAGLFDNVEEKTGYECALYLKDLYKERGLEFPVQYCHSFNPVGQERINNVINKQ